MHGPGLTRSRAARAGLGSDGELYDQYADQYDGEYDGFDVGGDSTVGTMGGYEGAGYRGAAYDDDDGTVGYDSAALYGGGRSLGTDVLADMY